MDDSKVNFKNHISFYLQCFFFSLQCWTVVVVMYILTSICSGWGKREEQVQKLRTATIDEADEKFIVKLC